MDIEGFSGAATVALACTIVFVLVTKSWQIISRSVSSHPSFAGSIMREAAQRFRDEFDRLTRTQTTYLSAALVFVVLFIAAYVLNAERLYAGYPQWQLYLFLVALLFGGLLALFRLMRTIAARQQVKLIRDANIAIGHQLHRYSADFGHVYHDVTTSAGVIDHVIVGQNGAYAVNVFARRPSRNGDVYLDNNKVVFRPADKSLSIVATAKKIAALEREFRRLLDHRVRVRSVIAIPGWQITEQSSDEHLLVNDRSLPMLRGWKDQADYLMNEDVNALHNLLTTRCSLVADNQDTAA
ncbi:MAG: NERD domain-containing protein [Gammaproteobacteria bacterium]|nr:NERD domain-containing protein [Gammaproteobacteria bacterium]MDH3371953.1 NERD domain-containing protein [Gammaproteobacteria bacterium]MDH3408519.1 NERD domain-containing protein [Gammaproteobacteria bacterium]MDH3553166.1 NERD domain-containing protein [Gammaproteobacteria bacterium]